jgi:predicted Ser/Thr protein kinase
MIDLKEGVVTMNSHDYANSIVFDSNRGSIRVKQHHKDLVQIGTGRSACVFRIKGTNKVIKVFPSQFTHIAQIESDIYRMLTHIDYFPTIYETGPNFLIMDYIKGETLFSCLNKGIPIDIKHINEVDHILDLVRKVGLNPSDIHLRNIIITPDNKIKMIDVARFKQEKQCTQWEDLKNGYIRFYQHPLFPKKFPEPILNLIAALYKRKIIFVNADSKKKVSN